MRVSRFESGPGARIAPTASAGVLAGKGGGQARR